MYNINSLKRKMLVKYPFFGSVIANVDYKETTNIPTACTDGKIIYYNPEFITKLSKDEQIFLLAHEVCHIAFNHILRSEGKDARLWNIATDAVINQFLKRDGLKMIEGVVDMADAINYDAEQLYEKLLKEQKEKEQEQKNKQQDNNNQKGNGQSNEQQSQNQQQGGGQSSEQQGQSNSGGQDNEMQPDPQPQQDNNPSGSQGGSKEQDKETQEQNQNGQSTSNDNGSQGGSSGSQDNEEKNNDVGHDTHKMWEEAVKKHKEEMKQKEQNQGSGSSSENDEEKDKTDSSKNDDSEKDKEKEKEEKLQQKQEELSERGEKEVFDKNKDLRKSLLEELRDAIADKVYHAPGSTTKGETRKVGDLSTKGYQPLIDWRYLLKEACQRDVDWSYRNAEIEDGVLSPRLEEQPSPETEIVLDTSGSIDETLLRNFLKECKVIFQQSKVKVGCFDTKFYGFEEIRNEEDIDKMKFKGFGGTDFDVAVNAFTGRTENKIIFTDGEAHMPKKAVDAIWIVFGNVKIKPVGGRVIYIDSEQLRRLMGGRTR